MISPHEATRDALGAIYSGADEDDAAAFLDQLADRGYRVTLTREAARRNPTLFETEEVA